MVSHSGVWFWQKKFLKRPLYDIRMRGNTQTFSSLLQQQPAAHGSSRITNPCPRCVKGTCRLRKHQQLYNNQLKVSGSSSSSNSSPLARGGL
jgi:hypothetical protein